jgi:putative CocE/NonD family hydrolase
MRAGGFLGRSLVAVAVVASGLIAGAGSARADAPLAPQVASDARVAMSDGVELAVKVGGRGPLVNGVLPARPTIVELSPYRPGCCGELAGPDYNYLEVHIRGTGDSDGSFDALGERSQRDVVEILDWACHQPWSNGRLGLYGFSASAIMVYDSLHAALPCVQTAVLGAGTHELYRDLMYPGGIPNLVPALGVLALIGAPSLQAGPDRLARNPLSALTTLQGMLDTGLAYPQHPTLDGWWRERGMRGDVNHLPILMITGFFDVESRGPFQTFQELRGDGAHLMVVGAHDGVPAGSGGSDAERQRWYDRYLRDIDNGVDSEPAVKLWLSDGDREDMLAGDFVTTQGTDWPIPGTRWASLTLDANRSGTATSLNDGTLHAGPAPSATQSYVEVPSLPTATDPHTTALLGGFNSSPILTDMTLVEPLGLSYTTEPFAADVVSAGPASLELVLSSTAPETDIFTVVSDVAPDGTAHPVATGRLRTAYPGVDLSRSLVDDTGAIVQPYGRYDQPDPAPIGQERRYHVELWPIGNRFQAGHRLRLHIVGASAYHQPSLPALNTIRLGGDNGSRLLLPLLPGSDIGSAATAPALAVSPASAVIAESSRAVGASLPATGGSPAPALAGIALLLAAAVLRRAAATRP